MKLKGSLDAAALSRTQARRLQELLNESGFFDLPPVLKSAEPAADRFNYRVTVETEGRVHTVEAGEAALPGSMRPFLDFLARSIRGR